MALFRFESESDPNPEAIAASELRSAALSAIRSAHRASAHQDIARMAYQASDGDNAVRINIPGSSSMSETIYVASPWELVTRRRTIQGRLVIELNPDSTASGKFTPKNHGEPVPLKPTIEDLTSLVEYLKTSDFKPMFPFPVSVVHPEQIEQIA